MSRRQVEGFGKRKAKAVDEMYYSHCLEIASFPSLVPRVSFSEEREPGNEATHSQALVQLFITCTMYCKLRKAGCGTVNKASVEHLRPDEQTASGCGVVCNR